MEPKQLNISARRLPIDALGGGEGEYTMIKDVIMSCDKRNILIKDDQFSKEIRKYGKNEESYPLIIKFTFK